MCEWEGDFDKEESNKITQRWGESQLNVILWLSAFGCTGRQQRLRGIKSWEVRLKVNEAEQSVLREKQFAMTKMTGRQPYGLRCCYFKRNPEVFIWEICVHNL